MGRYDSLKLKNQLCFPLYACSREIIKKYNPLLKEIDLTYTQYIAMMVFWEHKKMSVKDLLYSMMVPSGNDAALTLADYIGGGSTDKFVKMMNEKAEELGCENTHFMNPDGRSSER